MNDFTEGAQIVVSRSALMRQLGSFTRLMLGWAGGWMAGRGYLDAGVAAALPGLLMTAIGFGWGQIAARRTQKVQVALADKLPDLVAVAK